MRSRLEFEALEFEKGDGLKIFDPADKQMFQEAFLLRPRYYKWVSSENKGYAVMEFSYVIS